MGEIPVKTAYIGIHTLTEGEKALRLLRSHRIPARLGRMPFRTGEGCAHALRLPADAAEEARKLLNDAGIRTGKLLYGPGEAGAKNRRHDLP